MKYVLPCFFWVSAMLPLARAVSGLRSGFVDLKLYLPLASKSLRPRLYWAFICFNFLAFGLFVSAGFLMLRELR